MIAPGYGPRFGVALAVTLSLLAARLTAVSSISDPVAAGSLGSLHLSVPTFYLVFAPVFTLWDGISMLSLSRLRGFLLGLAILYLLCRTVRWVVGRRRVRRWPRAILRELGILLLSTVMLLGFLLLGALWHRPMLSLAGVSPQYRVVDFHSHTNSSHDVAGTFMGSFDAAANRRWHRRAGFDAAFITDHNTVEGWKKRDRRPETRDQGRVVVLCPGLEVSAWRAHIVLLGDTMPVDRGPYSSSLAGLLDLLQDSEARFGALSMASLPEYRRNHWSRLDTLVAAGLDGFEIVNASPKANELTRMERDSVISLARVHNLFVAGVSDSHGWGATSMVWNLVQIPPAMPSSSICGAVLSRLHDGFSAVRIYERHRLRADAWWPMWLTPLGMLWETWRGMDWQLTGAWLVWIWLLWGVGRLIEIGLRKKAGRANIAQGVASRYSSMED
jgi:hypothetical protein